MFRFKRFVSIITAASLTASLILNTAFITPVSADEECMSASDCVNAIGAGWNLGNTLDANGTWITADAGNYMAYETAWGNPVTTQAMIDSVRDKGFNAIRIPVTWSQHIDGNGHVNEAWMDRVKTIVDYCYNDGLYVILNVHHDTGEGGGDKVSWIFAENSTYDSVSAKYAGLWTEIANTFKDYNDHLLFEGYNEMLDSANTWNAPRNAASYQAVNNFAQLFVDTVRATGGRNSTRNLIVNTYVSSVDQAVLDNFTLPTDSAEGHLICEVHCYHPWGFTGTSQSVTWTSVHSNFGDSDKFEIDEVMNRLALFSGSKGVPVIIGEYGAEFKGNEDQIALYASYLVNAAGNRGIKCFYWDNGDFKTSGEGGYAIFDRNTLNWKNSIVSAIVDAAQPYIVEAEPTPAETEATSETSSEGSGDATAESSAPSDATSETSATVPDTEPQGTQPAEEPAEDTNTSSLLPLIVIDVVLVAAAAGLSLYYFKRRHQH